MENQLYSFNYGNYGSGAPINMSSTTKYFPRSVTEPYIASDTPLLGYSSYFSSSEPLSSSSMLFNRSDSYAAASNVIPPLSTVSTQPLQLSSHLSWPGPPGVDVGPGTASSATDFYAGLKRPGADAIYHPTITSTYNMIGQNEALFSTNPLYKRPRVESACNFPVYPLRPGEKNCIHYMLTRTCMYGDSCKFNHPIWVPEGGIPDWKEVPPVNAVESLPERPGEPDCPYFVKTQQCRYGSSCKFNHPKASATAVNLENADFAGLPERPSEPPCAFYMKTGTCRYGTTCKFHHPKDLQVLPAGQENNRLENTSLNGSETAGDLMITKPLITPALVHNSIGLPIRQGEVDCPFYLKTGSCKFSATCRYNHPEINTTYPTVATIGTSTTQHVNLGTVPASSITQTFDPKITQTTVYPPVAAIGTSTAQHLNFGAVPASLITQTYDPKITQTTVYPPVAAMGTSTAQHLNFGAVPASSITPTFDPKITQTTVYPPVAAIGTSTAQHLNFGAVPASSITQAFDPKLTQTTVYPPVTSIGTSTAQHLNFGAVPASSITQTFDPRITQTALQFDTVPAIYPQRPGELECDFYMKTGECKFGQRCRFHHPFDRSASSLVAVKDAQQQIVKLNLAGLPRREGSIHCPFYMKTGACKYGATCKFDHPSPGEVMTSTNSQATAEEQGKADETKAETDNK